MDQDEAARVAATEETAIQRLLNSALPAGWAVLGRCRQGGLGPAPQPTGCHVLAHAEVGVALLDVAPHTTPNAEARLRRLLGAEDFGERFPGTLPIWHGRVEPGQLHRLPALLQQAFAALPPATVSGDGGWIVAVRGALDADPAWEAAGRAKRPAAPLPDAPFLDDEDEGEDEPDPRPGRPVAGSRRLLLGLGFAGVFLLGLGAGALLVPGQEEAGSGGRLALADPPPQAQPMQSTAGTAPTSPAVPHAAAPTSPAVPHAAAPAGPVPEPRAAGAGAVVPEAMPQAALPPTAGGPSTAGAHAPAGGPSATTRAAAPEAGAATAADRAPLPQLQAAATSAAAPTPVAPRSGDTAAADQPPSPAQTGLAPVPPTGANAAATAGTDAPAPVATGPATPGDEAPGRATPAAEVDGLAAEAGPETDLPLPPAAVALRPPRARPAPRASLSYDRRCGDALFRWQQGARLTSAEMAFVRNGCVASARR